MLTETFHAGAFIVSEGEGWFSRDAMTVALSQTLLAGTVLGSRAVIAGVTSVAVADVGNTGNGVLTLDAVTPVLAGVKNGTYRAVCIAVAANAGTFEVFDPNGALVGRVQVAATFSNQIKFVIADGATDFAAGDAFSIAVVVEGTIDEQICAFDSAGVDGSQNIVGLLIYPITTDGVTTQKGAVLRRRAEVRASDLTWPAAISAVNKAAGIEQLRKLGIIPR